MAARNTGRRVTAVDKPFVHDLSVVVENDTGLFSKDLSALTNMNEILTPGRMWRRNNTATEPNPKFCLDDTIYDDVVVCEEIALLPLVGSVMTIPPPWAMWRTSPSFNLKVSDRVVVILMVGSNKLGMVATPPMKLKQEVMR
jgi:hypothetical protein